MAAIAIKFDQGLFAVPPRREEKKKNKKRIRKTSFLIGRVNITTTDQINKKLFRVGQGGGGGGSGIPQIPPNIPKNNRSFEYFIPEIRS